MYGMTTFEMSVIFDADSEETAVEAVDSLGAAFTEHLTGWAASIKSTTPESVRIFKPPTKLIDMPEIIEMAKHHPIKGAVYDEDFGWIKAQDKDDEEPEVGDPAYEDPEDAA